MVIRLLICVVVAVAIVPVECAQADGGKCGQAVDLGGAAGACEYSPEEAKAMVLGDSESHAWRVVRQCAVQGQVRCQRPVPCGDADAVRWLYDIFRDGVLIGTTCLDDADAESLGVLTPGMVVREFKRLSWPKPDLVIQPPGGQTLVNLETVFHTTNTEPTSQTVTLLGTQVTIEASPVSYVWRFGDGTSVTSSDSGRPYPNQTISHTYADAGQVGPSVDVTYQGRFRVESGPWQQIDETLTVSGDSQSLVVRSAQPKLVDAN